MGLRQVSRTNPNATTKIQSFKKWDSTPLTRCQVLVYFRGFRWRSLYALQITCSQFFPFRIHGLGTWIMSWMFLIFIVLICWSLDNLVSASLPLEVQSWGIMMESLYPFDFSWYDSPSTLFTSGRGCQKIDGTALSPFSKAWFPCMSL